MTILRTTSETTIRETSMQSSQENCDYLMPMSKFGIERSEEENNVNDGIADAMMQRGAYLRMLRQLEMEDEAERRRETVAIKADKRMHDGEESSADDAPSLSNTASLSSLSTAASEDSATNAVAKDRIDVMYSTDGLKKYKVLEYGSFLSHQRYYDDLKHANVDFIDYGLIKDSNGNAGGRLVIEQCKSLGKGGLCWDAAFILSEYMIAHEKEWNRPFTITDDDESNGYNLKSPTKVVELGSGTGLGGLMIAKAISNCQVTITDLPELVDLMKSNIERNFGEQHSATDGDQSKDDPITPLHFDNLKDSQGRASAKTLRWGVKEDYKDAPFDVIFGADVVTSLYDPIALAHTLYDLSHETTKVYVSVKSRLSKPHELFEGEMKKLFEKVEIMRNVEESRNKNPDTAIIVAEGLKR